MKHRTPVANDQPQGWEINERGSNSKLRFDSENRKRKVICTEVGTSSGVVWNCVLYVTDKRYGSKRHTDSTIARSTDEIPDAISTLDARN